MDLLDIPVVESGGIADGRGFETAAQIIDDAMNAAKEIIKNIYTFEF